MNETLKETQSVRRTVATPCSDFPLNFQLAPSRSVVCDLLVDCPLIVCYTKPDVSAK